MLTFTFYYGDTAPIHLQGQTIGSITDYSARSGYLHLTGRNLTADVMKHGVWYDISGYDKAELTD
jgi:hypothetical protein